MRGNAGGRGQTGNDGEDPIIDALLERQARVDEDLATLQYVVARRRGARPPVRGTHAGGTERQQAVKRREFLSLGLLLTGLAAIDVEAVTGAVAGLHRLDAGGLEHFRMMTRIYQQQYDITPPRDLLRSVRLHLLCLRALRAPAASPVARDLDVLIGESAVMAGRLSQRIHNRADAEDFLNLAEGMANEAGDSLLRGLALAAKSSLYSNIDSGRPLGRPPAAISLLTEAETAAGRAAPPSFRAWVLAHRAEEHAAAGDGGASDRDLEAAETALSQPAGQDDGFFHGWSSERLAGYRGCCGVLLQRADVLPVLESAFNRTTPEMISQRSAVTIDLATGYARQGEIDHASDLLSETLSVALRSHLPEMARRIGTVRRFELGNGTLPSVKRLDEQLRSAAISH